MVTAELAACLPVLVLVLAVAVTAVSMVATQVRVQDAAREAARADARGDGSSVSRLVAETAPGGTVSVHRSGTTVTAVVAGTVHPLGGWLPALTVHATAVAAVEPRAGAP